MRRFWVTARVFSPNDVFTQYEQQAEEDGKREDDDPEAPPGDRQSEKVEGAAHEGRGTDLAVGRPEDRAHPLLQGEADAECGEQGFQRAPVEEADDEPLDQDADQSRHEEGAGDADGQRPREQGGRLGADRLLHEIGRVGPEHHHLAMGHVDDAHHAEGDGEPDGREQQHRAQRDAVPDVLKRPEDREPGLDGGDASSGGSANRLARICIQAAQDAHGVAVAPRLNGRDRREPIGLGCAGLGEEDSGAGLGHGLLDARILLPRESGIEGRQRRRVAGLEHGLGRLPALRGIGVHEVELALRRLDAPADLVVGAHGLEIGIVGRGGAGLRLDQGVSLANEQGLVRRPREEPPVRQGREHGARPRITAGGEPRDTGLDLGIAVTRKLGVGVGRLGQRGAGDEEQEEGEEAESCSRGSGNPSAREAHGPLRGEGGGTAGQVGAHEGVLSAPPHLRLRPRRRRQDRCPSHRSRACPRSAHGNRSGKPLRVGRWGSGYAPPHFLVLVL